MSEKAISIVTEEWEALAGLPYLQVRLYLVLRWYMSVATRRTGEARGISLQSLCEELYIEPAPGRSDSGSPTKKAVRSALQQLEKHGLVQPCGNGEVLVFFLPKAGSAEARQKAKGHQRGTGKGQAIGQAETTAAHGFEGSTGHVMGHGENSTKGHSSEERVNHPYTKALAPARSEVGNLSTAPVLLPPLDSSNVAEWIRLHERRRGCRAKVMSGDARIAEWLAKGVSAEQLGEAYNLAVADRELRNSDSPVNTGFLHIFVGRVLEAGLVSRKGGADLPDEWHTNWTGLERKAEELGIPPFDNAKGESFGAFQRRVLTASRRAVGLNGVRHG